MPTTPPRPTSGSVPFGEWRWILTLFGTAVGAGILYLPLQVGRTGMWALLALSAVVFPLIYLSHRFIVSLLLLEKQDMDYTGVVVRHFGPLFGIGFVFVFFLTFYFVLFSYAIGLNANLGDFLLHSGMTSTNWAHGPFLSLAILVFFAILLSVGDSIVLWLMGLLSSTLLVVLLGISVYLIPFWDFAAFQRLPSPSEFFDDTLLILPILTFSFVFFPAMSSMVSGYRNSAPSETSQAHRHLNRIVLKTSALLLVFVLFFVLSSILALSPEELERAIEENLNGLTILSHKEAIPNSMANLGAIVGLFALITSFTGVLFAVRDAAHGLVRRTIRRLARTHSRAHSLLDRMPLVETCTMGALFAGLWILTLVNPSVMSLFGLIISPLVACFLFLLPVAILFKVHGWRILKQPAVPFIFFMGILILFSFELGTWLKTLL